MALLQTLATSDALVVLELISTYHTATPVTVEAAWDNKPTWDNWRKTPAPFDNRPTWDNWNKKK